MANKPLFVEFQNFQKSPDNYHSFQLEEAKVAIVIYEGWKVWNFNHIIFLRI